MSAPVSVCVQSALSQTAQTCSAPRNDSCTDAGWARWHSRVRVRLIIWCFIFDVKWCVRNGDGPLRQCCFEVCSVCLCVLSGSFFPDFPFPGRMFTILPGGGVAGPHRLLLDWSRNCQAKKSVETSFASYALRTSSLQVQGIRSPSLHWDPDGNRAQQSNQSRRTHHRMQSANRNRLSNIIKNKKTVPWHASTPYQHYPYLGAEKQSILHPCCLAAPAKLVSFASQFLEIS